MSRPRKTSPVPWPSLMAPMRSDMPNSVTILRAMPVAFSMSLLTPVVGRDLALLGRHDAGALLRAGDDAVDGLVERDVVDDLLVAARGEQRGLVEDVGEVGTGEAGRAPRDGEQVDVARHGLALGVHREDAVAAEHVRRVDGDLAVEAARAQQRR